MAEQRGFSLDTVRRANMMMIMGIKPEYHISDKLSDEDIERAWRIASEKVGFFSIEKAEQMMRENEREKELPEPRMELQEPKRPFRAVGRFFYGVLQQSIGMCLATLVFYIILKVSGKWDTLLNNLFR